MNDQNILHRPFHLHTHKQTFLNYLEVIITSDGVVHYAVPSHQEKLIAIACKKRGVTRDELNNLCPPEYYCDFTEWLCYIADCVALWNAHMMGVANDAQLKTIHTLVEEGVYHGMIYSHTKKEDITWS